jgi:hypothetical protein
MQGNLNEILKELPPDVARAVARYGVKLAIDLLQTLYSDLGGAEAERLKPKIGRPRKVHPEAEAQPQPGKPPFRSGWSDDPEERKREMARRMAVTAAKRTKANRSTVAKQRWAAMSKAQREAWQRSMQGARYPKSPKKPTVREARLEQAS